MKKLSLVLSVLMVASTALAHHEVCEPRGSVLHKALRMRGAGLAKFLAPALRKKGIELIPAKAKPIGHGRCDYEVPTTNGTALVIGTRCTWEPVYGLAVTDLEGNATSCEVDAPGTVITGVTNRATGASILNERKPGAEGFSGIGVSGFYLFSFKP